ncbi:hypothetical protein DFP72DRAFT_1180208 [Ephemerocybe angulata]|uniref:Uncharacterized protein n=1 Tax=Ephemerocybe angulata TaxID=980116 RepID=A0A8H6H736_9AGAR|nr:hypothetical protein DFP72DRAFT_1180208 [Tulosesus angulatus]
MTLVGLNRRPVTWPVEVIKIVGKLQKLAGPNLEQEIKNLQDDTHTTSSPPSSRPPGHTSSTVPPTTTSAVKEDILSMCCVGGESSLGSHSRVPGAGHLVVQMNPAGLSEKILDALARDAKL